MADIDKRINEIKNSRLEELTSPCAVFMTFENEEGAQRAMAFNDTIDGNPGAFGHLQYFMKTRE